MMMNPGELAEFYTRIGAAIWHVQYLEDVLVTFLTAKVIHERRCAGQRVKEAECQALLAEKRRLTLGPLIETCSSRKVIRQDLQARFGAFRTERHWLVHRSMVENGDDLYQYSTRNAVLNRIAAIQQEAIALKKLVVADCDAWMTSHGIDVAAAQAQAEDTILKLNEL